MTERLIKNGFNVLEKFSFQKIKTQEIEQGKKNIVFKIFYFEDEWINISLVEDILMLRICSHPIADRWIMQYNEAMEALEKAQQELNVKKSELKAEWLIDDKEIVDQLGSVFPNATGSPDEVNEQGQAILDNILTHPEAITTNRHHPRFKNILEIKVSQKGGVRFTDDSEMIGLLEPVLSWLMFRVQVASVTDRDYLVYEVWCNDFMWAEILTENPDQLFVEFYFPKIGGFMPFNEAIASLNIAAEKLKRMS